MLTSKKNKDKADRFMWVGIGLAAGIFGVGALVVVMESSPRKGTAQVGFAAGEGPQKLAGSSKPAEPTNTGKVARGSAESNPSTAVPPPDRQAVEAKDRILPQKPDTARASPPAMTEADAALEREARERRRKYLTGELVNKGLDTRPLSASEKLAPKAPLPDARALADAAKRLNELYGPEWAAAKTDAAKRALAQKFLQEAWETEKNAPARFVLLRSCRELATQAMDGMTAFKAIEDMDHLFQIDALQMRAEVLIEGASIADTTVRHLGVANKAAEVADEAVSADNFSVARRLNSLVLDEAKKGGDSALEKRAQQRAAELNELTELFEAQKTAEATLKNSPADPEANLIVGKYACFAKGDWQIGLSKFARGGDEALKALAARDAAAVAATQSTGCPAPAESVRLGDAWWALAEAQKGIAKTKFQQRAAFWYRNALPELTGTAKERVSKRLQGAGL